MQNSFQSVISGVVRTTIDLWQKGWAEANAGNISVRLAPGTCEGQEGLEPRCDWILLDTQFPNLAIERILITGTGTYMHNVELSPEDNLGVIEIDASGGKYRILWGYASGDRPTSELPTHLRAHSVRKRVSNDSDRAVLHTHCPNITAMTLAAELDTVRISKLLWQMHTECIINFPEGIEFVPWILPGSVELGEATAKGLEKRRLILWQYHGIVAAGPTLDKAFGLIDTAESAAQIYLKSVGAGGVRNKLSDKQLQNLAAAFSLKVDPSILNTQV